jgi:hypothetical protein
MISWIDGSVSVGDIGDIGGKYRLLLPQLAAAASAATAHSGGLALDSRVTIGHSIRVEGPDAIVIPPTVTPSDISLSHVQAMLVVVGAAVAGKLLVGRMEEELHELAAMRHCNVLLSSEPL